MRVTNRKSVDNALEYIQENIERIDLLRIHVGSTKIIQDVSDDPTAVSASLSIKSSIAANKTYINTAHTTNRWMDINEMALSEIEKLAMQAFNKAQSGVSEVLDPTSFQALKIEFKSILNQVIDLANTQHEGDYVFAGTCSHTTPFTLIESPFSVTYNGDDNEIILNLGPSENVTVNVNGQAVFRELFNSLISGTSAVDRSDLEITAGDLKNALDTLRQTRTINEAKQRQVLSAIVQGEETDLSLQALLSNNEDVRLVEALRNLQQQEIVYQTVLEVASRTLTSMNLFEMM